jgi:peptide deformylase
MAILKIARMGHPILRRRAEEIADPTAHEIHALADDMLQTMVDAPIVSAQGGWTRKKRRYLSLNLDSIRSSFWFSFR